MSAAFPGAAAARAWLFQASDYERLPPAAQARHVFGLETMNLLLERLGRPERRFAALHVAGSKGKGSVSAILAALLAARGGRIGLYTSPHLADLAERIVVDGEPISGADLAAVLGEIRAACAGLPGRPTFFELITAAAFLHFARRGVEWAAVEVGLGGRLDATNVLEPRAAAITNIALEHTGVLGATIEAIAGEKAGIVKPGVPLCCGAAEPARAVIAARCRERGAPLLLAGRDFAGAAGGVVPGERPGLVLDLRTRRARHSGLFLPLAGRHQADNAALALAVLEEGLGEAVDPGVVARGLANVRLRGRIEVVPGAPPVVLDGCHTPESAAALAATLDELFPGRPRTYLFALARDKRLPEILAVLRPNAAGFFPLQVDALRGFAAGELAAAWGAPARPVSSCAEGLARARESAGPEGLVVACGSLYLVGEMIREGLIFVAFVPSGGLQ